MSIPEEFTPETVRERSPREEQLYSAFLRSREPFLSLFENNPWLIPPDPRKPLEWGTGGYWDTTVARKHDHWKHVALPSPTKDIRQMRADLREWGFCLIEDGLSAEQYTRMRTRLLEQAEGERRAGVAAKTPSGQYVHSLVNKGACFVRCIEQDPDAVQAGPVIEQIMNETLGRGWICHSFLANGADPGGHPQALHLDQSSLFPWMTQQAPALFNTMFLLEDVNEENGGTLVVPGSHRAFRDAGSAGTIGPLPPAINLEARGGTIMLFDGRLLHGTGANRSSERRFVATMSNIPSWMRSQENWSITVAPDVLEAASPKLLHRMGFQAIVYGGTVEGFGIGGRGRVDDPWCCTKTFRTAYDAGNYLRVRELGPDSPWDDLERPYTLRVAADHARSQTKETP